MAHDDAYFRNPPERRVGALAALRNTDGDLMLVKKEYQVAEGKTHPWGLVGGSVEGDEWTRVAWRREVLEETGLALPVGRLLVIDHVYRSPRYAEGTNYVYDTHMIAADTKITLPQGELSEYRFVPRDAFST